MTISFMIAWDQNWLETSLSLEELRRESRLRRDREQWSNEKVASWMFESMHNKRNLDALRASCTEISKGLETTHTYAHRSELIRARAQINISYERESDAFCCGPADEWTRELYCITLTTFPRTPEFHVSGSGSERSSREIVISRRDKQRLNVRQQSGCKRRVFVLSYCLLRI